MAIQRTWLMALLTATAFSLPVSAAKAQYDSYFSHGGRAPEKSPYQTYDWAEAPVYLPSVYGPAPFGPAPYGPAPYGPPMFDAQPASYGAPGLVAGGQSVPPELAVNHYGESAGHGSAGCEGDYLFGSRGFQGPYRDNQCGPRWFNVHAEFMYLKREDVATRRQNFTSDNVAGPIVLSTDDLSLDEAPGFRVTGRWDIGAASDIEASYFGTFGWSGRAEARSDFDDLYSVFSNFGLAPPGGFLETDQTHLQRIEYTSDLNSVELNFRRHWAGQHGGLHGSWLVGVRYTSLNERFRYLTRAQAHTDPFTAQPRGPGSMNYAVRTTNDLVGFQLGGDLFACILPGLMIGGELKAGVYGNQATQNTSITATTIGTPVQERVTGAEVAFIAEAGTMFVYQFHPNFSFRGGYQFLFIDGLALAPDNFNATQPFLNTPPVRTPFLDQDGNVFYHGFTAGVEWLW